MRYVAVSAIGLAVMTACSGGGGDSTAKISLSGTVAAGDVRAAKVCLDLNSNDVCDVQEPSVMSGSDGSYTISDIKKSDGAKFPVIVEMPAAGIDPDAGTAVRPAYVLSAPPGQHGFVSPLSTLVHMEMQAGATLAAATAKVKSDAGVSVDPLENYVAEQARRANDAVTRAAYAAAHDAARVLVNSVAANYAQLQDTTGAGERKAVMGLLWRVAEYALMSQATPEPDKLVGVEDPNTLRAMLAAKTTSAAAATQDVVIHFDLVNGPTSVRCGDAISLANSAYDRTSKTAARPRRRQNTPGRLIDTRFYIANVMLIDASGNATPVYMLENDRQAKNVAMLDFGYDSSGAGTACSNVYNTAIVGRVKPGRYVGVSMTMGVPVRSADMTTQLNHSAPAATTTTPIPLQSAALNWSWQSGRKFMKLEFRPDAGIARADGTTTTKWNVHIGSTGCAGDPARGLETACTNANRLSLRFADFDAGNHKIVLDIAQLFAGSDVAFEGGGAAGCMSGTTDPECPAIFEALGLGLTGADAGRTLTGADAQTVFSVRR